jgi:hypothetical protein
MIANPTDYEKAQEELRLLADRLQRLQQSPSAGAKAGVRKMIVRLHEELTVYEGSEEIRHPHAR